MPRIDTYTANLADTRGIKGQVQTEIDIGSAQRPGVALQNLGQTIEHAGLTTEHIAEVQRQRQQEQDIRWVGDAKDQLSRVLIQWQQDNAHREDVGDAYRKFADEQVAEYMKGAPNARAADDFRLKVAPSINEDWASNLKHGELLRLNNFKVSQEKNSQGYIDAFRHRMDDNQTESAKDLMSHDLASQLDDINKAFRLTPGQAAATKEKAIVDAVIGATEKDPIFAKEILNAYSKDIEPSKRQALLTHIETAQFRDAGLKIDAAAQKFQDDLANGISKNIVVPKPNFAALQPLFKSEQQFQEFSTEWNQKFEIHNKATEVINALAPLNSQARAIELSKAQATLSNQGIIGLKAQTAIAQANQTLIKQFEADPAGYVTRNNPDLNSLYLSYSRAQQRGSAPNATPEEKAQSQVAESTWRRAMWDRQGYPSKSDPFIMATVGVLRPDVTPKQANYAATFQGLPESERRIITQTEAERWGAIFTKGSMDERFAGMRALKSSFPDPRQFAVALKDVEQLNPGKQDVIQRLQIAQAHETTNPALAAFILSENGTEVWKATKEDVRKEITDAIDNDRNWRNFALVSRGATAETMDMVNGYRRAVEQWAAFRTSSSLTPTAAAKEALQTVIFRTLGMPVNTPAFESSPASPLWISRKALDARTGKEDATLPLRTDDDMAAIAANLAYSKDAIMPEDIRLFDSQGNPSYALAIPWMYSSLNADKQISTANRARLKASLMSNSMWVSDPDGQGATLYLNGIDGTTFAPLLKTGLPIHRRFSDSIRPKAGRSPAELQFPVPLGTIVQP